MIQKSQHGFRVLDVIRGLISLRFLRFFVANPEIMYILLSCLKKLRVSVPLAQRVVNIRVHQRPFAVPLFFVCLVSFVVKNLCVPCVLSRLNISEHLHE